MCPKRCEIEDLDFVTYLLENFPAEEEFCFEQRFFQMDVVQYREKNILFKKISHAKNSSYTCFISTISLSCLVICFYAMFVPVEP